MAESSPIESIFSCIILTDAMSNRPTDQELRKSYRRLGTISAVAAESDVAFETARRWLTNAGVELQPKGRPSKQAAKLNAAALAKRYRDGESLATIGEAAGVSPATVRARLIDAGVELRPRRGWNY